MQNFARVRQVEASGKAVDNDQESTASALQCANQHNDHIAGRVDVQCMRNTVVYFAGSQQFFAHTQRNFDWQEFDKFVKHVKW